MIKNDILKYFGLKNILNYNILKVLITHSKLIYFEIVIL